MKKQYEPEELTTTELEELKKDLESVQNKIFEQETMGSISSTMVIPREEMSDSADLASAELDNERSLKLVAQERKKLESIKEALQKIEEGSYGFCEFTGDPSSYKRLKVKPWAKYSVAYQEELERKR